MLTILAPAATILVGLLGLAGVIITIRQRARSEAQDRYWKRLEWALNASEKQDPRTREAALASLHSLLYDPNITAADQGLIRAVIIAHYTTR